MFIIVAGAGKLGSAVASNLVKEKHQVTIIDKHQDILDKAQSTDDLNAVCGSAVSCKVLSEANVEECEFFIALTGSDEINLISCILAKKMGAAHTFACVNDPEYAEDFSLVRQSIGVDRIQVPALEAAREISRALRFPSAISVESFAQGQVNIVGIKVKEDSKLNNLQVRDFKNLYGEILICAIRRNGEVTVPNGEVKIKSGDVLHVTGNKEVLSDFYARIDKNIRPIRRILIVGGGRVAYWLLKLISKSKIRATVIENKFERAALLAKEIGEAHVLHGDGTDYQFLDEQNLPGYDAFLSLTGVDEENVLASIYASHAKVRKTITKISRTKLLEILDDSDLQNVVTPHRIVTDMIVRTIRASRSYDSSQVESLHRFGEGQVEALEFIVSEGFPYSNITLQDLKLLPDTLIAWIIRKGKLIFPGGHDVILPHDRVIVVTKTKGINRLDEIVGGAV